MNTSDRELLELAAKAAGYKFSDYTFKGEDGICLINPPKRNWNPLENDGDAFRLAVKLKLSVQVLDKCSYVQTNPETILGWSSVSELEMFVEDDSDACNAATRRAIVRAAAEIGKEMQ